MSSKKEIKTENSEVKVTRDNFAFVAAGLFMYEHAGDAKDCEVEGAFTCVQSKNFGVRVGDLVICKDANKAIFVVVK